VSSGIVLVALCLATTPPANGQITYTWSQPTVGANDWNVAGNWSASSGNSYPGTAASDIVVFGNAGIATSASTVNNIVSVNTTIAALTYALTTTSSSDYQNTEIPSGVTLTVTGDVAIGSGTSAAGLDIISNKSLVLGANQRWANNSANVLTVSAVISGTANLTNAGSGTILLGSSNTYGGSTLLTSGTLSLGASGSISNSPEITIGAGATFDVSAITAFNLSSDTSLTVSGNATPAVFNGAPGGSVNLGSQPITLNYDGLDPALTVAQGILVLNGNAFTVNAASPLSPGAYTLVQQSSGSISGTGPFSVSGTAIPSGSTPSIVVSVGNVNLIIAEPSAFSNLTPSQSVPYGTTSITLGGTVSGSGPVYLANGEPIAVTIDGTSQGTAISDSTGDFSILYDPASIPVTGSPFAVTYSYAGNNGPLLPSSDSSTMLTITPANLTITANDLSVTEGLPIPPLTASYVGFVNDESSASLTTQPALSTTATSESPAGQYPITVTNAVDPNYNISYASGTLTVVGPPKIGGLSVSAGQLEFSFPTITGQTYQLNVSSNLGTHVWTPVGNPIPGTGASVSTNITVSASGASFFSLFISQ
jgi:autotransporter-associated beta strand protein